jgi:hypothetical protein
MIATAAPRVIGETAIEHRMLNASINTSGKASIQKEMKDEEAKTWKQQS